MVIDPGVLKIGVPLVLGAPGPRGGEAEAARGRGNPGPREGENETVSDPGGAVRDPLRLRFLLRSSFRFSLSWRSWRRIAQ